MNKIILIATLLLITPAIAQQKAPDRIAAQIGQLVIQLETQRDQIAELQAQLTAKQKEIDELKAGKELKK